jgi:hypothetical protein
MGSLPDSKYIIKTDGYWFVEAHDVDPSKGYISVSAKGIVNGLSNQPNDGADFGPDTYDPNYTGSGIPYTQTSGIQEAVNYMPTTYPSGGEIRLVGTNGGRFYIDAGILINTVNISLVGSATLGEVSIGSNSNLSYIIKSTAFYTIVKNIAIHGNTSGYSGIIATGIDFSQPSSIATNNMLDGVSFNGTFTSYIVNMDNNDACVWRNTQVGNTTDATAMVSWLVPGGAKATLIYCSVGTMQVAIQNLIVIGSYMDEMFVTVNSIPLMTIQIIGCYQDSGRPMINVSSGVTVSYLSWTGYFQIPNGGYVLDGSGTINKVSLDGLSLQVIGGTLPLGWANSTLTVNDYINLHGSFSGQPGETSIPNAPFNISSEGLLISGTATTPSVPASGTAQQNTNPYPVNVYIYGGTVTVIDYTPNGGSATQVGTAGPATVRLNPGDSITLTYSAAPTWNWVAV